MRFQNAVDNLNIIRQVMSGDAIGYISEIDEPEELYEESYIGEVVDNNDVNRYGRCKVRVVGIHDDIEDSLLPWAWPDMSFVGSLKGSFIVPPIGCRVSVYFDNGDLYLPRYISSKKVIQFDHLPSNTDQNYPNNMVFFETDNGTSFEIDRTDDSVLLHHKSGTEITIDPNGVINVLGKDVQIGTETVRKLIDERIVDYINTKLVIPLNLHIGAVVAAAGVPPVTLDSLVPSDVSTKNTSAS